LFTGNLVFVLITFNNKKDMNYIYTELINCNECREADRILDKYLFYLPGNQRAKLCSMVNHTKARIIRVTSEKKQSWGKENN
jgi:hypothetical protein